MVHQSKALTYANIFETWNAEQENRKALFIDFLYQRSGRTNGLFTGLWENFCMTEAGPVMREDFFKRLQFIEDVRTGKIKLQQDIPIS